MTDNTIITIDIEDREGITQSYEVPTDMGLNLMEVCKSYNLPVEGTCGGMALCASCHVYVVSDDILLHEPTDDELDMLDQAFFVKENSRLGCQIKFNDTSLDGLKVKLAPVGE